MDIFWNHTFLHFNLLYINNVSNLRIYDTWSPKRHVLFSVNFHSKMVITFMEGLLVKGPYLKLDQRLVVSLPLEVGG